MRGPDKTKTPWTLNIPVDSSPWFMSLTFVWKKNNLVPWISLSFFQFPSYAGYFKTFYVTFKKPNIFNQFLISPTIRVLLTNSSLDVKVYWRTDKESPISSLLFFRSQRRDLNHFPLPIIFTTGRPRVRSGRSFTVKTESLEEGVRLTARSVKILGYIYFIDSGWNLLSRSLWVLCNLSLFSRPLTLIAGIRVCPPSTP